MLAPDAMIVASATPDGRPSARAVLLRGLDERGFAFYTNFESRKGRELDANPYAAILFHWPEVHRQVRATGRVERVLAGRVRGVLEQSAAREPHQCVGVGAERDDRIARTARGARRGSGGALR